ncbi:MAG: membrane protein insertase YidC, partial [Gammaproteobacteria bacterium]
MDNIRFILIVTFAMLVFMMWQAWQLDYGPKPVVAEIVNPETGNIKEDLPTTAGTPAQTETEDQNPVLAPLAPPSAAKLVTVKTDVITLEIDMQGGTVTNLDLLNYPVEKANTYVNGLREMVGLQVAKIDTAPVRLFNSNQEKLFVAQSGLIASSGFATAPNHHTVFTSEQDNYTLQPGQDSLTVPLTWTDNNGLVFTKLFTFKRGSYEIILDQKVINNTGKAWSGRQYSQLLRVPDTTGKGNMLTGGMRAYNGGVIYTEKNKYQKISFDDMADETLDVTNKGGWTAMIQ